MWGFIGEDQHHKLYSEAYWQPVQFMKQSYGPSKGCPSSILNHLNLLSDFQGQFHIDHIAIVKASGD